MTDDASAKIHFPCTGTEIAEGQCMRIERGGESLIAVRRDGHIYVYRNQCPHQSTELDWLPGKFLNADATHIQCATHGALFELKTGMCIAGPCKGERLTAVLLERV